jgi:cytochrome P450
VFREHIALAARPPSAAMTSGLPGRARRHLTFAHGPHLCLGVHVACLEAQSAIRMLLHRLAGLRLDPRRPSAPRGLVVRKPPTLHVLWDDR